MEISWGWLSFYCGLLICPLCNAYPSNLEGIVADHETQFLTGLIGVVLIVCSLIFLAGCLCCQKRNNFKEFRNSPVVASVPSELDHGHVNPITNGEFTIFTPLSPPIINNNVFLPREQIVSSKLENYVHEGTDLGGWFDGSERDFPRIKLKYVKELGQGKFGKVVEGAAQGIFENEEEWTPVIVRILDSTSSHEEKLLFLKDALFYKCDPHPNILSLYGRCLETVPFLFLQEYCQDDLKSYLRSASVDDKNVSIKYLLWSTQLISALKHLHHFGFTHPDLACRNCLLTPDLNLKLGDYSLNTSKYPSDYYRGNSLVPIRWCDPESVEFIDGIQLKKLTPVNNIWSLGVTLWEICQCGEQPYANLTDEEVISQVLRSTLRLQKPIYSAPYMDNLYVIIQSCWSCIESRPNINQIDSVLFEILEGHMTQASDASSFSSDDFDKKWELLKPNSVVKSHQLADSISIEMTDNDIRILNPLSPSKGSLNNLLIEKCEPHVEFKFEDERNAGHANENPAIMEEVICHSDSSDQGSIKVETNFIFNENNSNNTRNFVYQRTSSSSETEDENWRKKVERGAYTEKVRMKSRSVADLMVLTHVDYSESESETPLPSLDYRVNYKNVRSNLENSYTFGSEGNLLSIQDTFQEELRKLQEERKDSLLFVPDTSSKSSLSKNSDLEKDSVIRDVNTLANSTKLLRELSSPERIQPSNQVYNVFNVSVENSPIYNNSTLHGIINLNSPFKFETDVTEAKIQGPNINTESFKVADPFESFSCDNVKSFSNKPIVNVKCDQQSSIANLDNIEKKQTQGQINIENNYMSNIKISAQVEDNKGQLEDNLNTNKSNLNESFSKQCQNNNDIGDEFSKDCLDCEQTMPKVDKTYSDFKEINHLPLIVTDTASPFDEYANTEQELINRDLISENETKLNISFTAPNSFNCEQNFNEKSENMLKESSQNSNNNIKTEVAVNINEVEEKLNNLMVNPYDFNQVSNDEINNTLNQFKNGPLTNNTMVEINSNNADENLLDLDALDIEIGRILEPEIKHDIFPIEPFETSLNENENFMNSTDVIESRQESKNDLIDIDIISEDMVMDFEQTVINKKSDDSVETLINSPDIIQSCKESAQVLEEESDFNDTSTHLSSTSVEKLLDLSSFDNKCETQSVSDNSLFELQNHTDVGDTNMIESLNVPKTKEITRILDGLNMTYSNNTNDKNGEQSNTLISPDDQSSCEFLSCEANIDNDLYNTSESLYSVLDHNELDPVRSEKDSILENCDDFKDADIKASDETHLELDNTEVLQTESQNQNENQSVEDENIQVHHPILVEIDEILEIAITSEKDSDINSQQEVQFDLSADQEEVMPNSLTHSCAFSSTPMRKKAIPVSIDDAYSSINLFSVPTTSSENEQNDEIQSELVPAQDNNRHENLSYSLETWDTFLNKTLNNQNNENMFDSFSSEPKSLLFVENEEIKPSDAQEITDEQDKQENQLDRTFTIEPENSCEETIAEKADRNSTYTKEEPEILGSEDSHDISWESGEGWFVHPQTSEEVSGEMQISTSTSDSYVGFGIDDEIMSAIRNELLSKLPHAQGSNVDRIKDESLLDSQETNEVFLRYNVYNTPLSPIPEESYIEDGSESNTPKQTAEEEDDDDSDWSERYEGPQDTESHSTRTLEGMSRGPLHRHTPSQDSCCSNDTLFNLEELNFATTDAEKENDEEIQAKDMDEVFEQNDILNSTYIVESTDNKVTEDLNIVSNEPTVQTINSALEIRDDSLSLQSLRDFLLNEREHSSNNISKVEKSKECTLEEPVQDLLNQGNFIYNKAQVVPLPSPENNPWKQLPVSLSCNMPLTSEHLDVLGETNELEYVNSEINECIDHVYENNLIENTETDPSTEPEYVNCDEKNSPDLDKDYNNYVNLINMENAKNSLESTDSDKDYVNVENFNTESVSDDNIYGILTDIRFNGPTDNQLMSTSFSESNNDEQEWDSGSDSRSSSSGEFIWKLEEIKPMEKIIEDQFEESDVSSSFSDDDDGETPEFIPSAWDKFAMPSKSALRSPEKTLNKSGDKKAKVWFKKQKYHCIYEYPKEPESPILQSHDLWKPQTDFKMYTDWEFDGEPYSVLTEDSDVPLDFEYKSNNSSSNRSLYQLTDVSDFMPGNTGLDEEFFISSSSQPFNAGSSSQFFPGSSKWDIENMISGSIENATPDSGVEDITPGSQTDNNEYTKIERPIPTLKQLASTAVNKNKQTNIKNEDVLGGLRHTRNKLKLDLPPSPNAFSNDKVFVVENNPEPVIREKPAFTTFGKSRFLVQHIDTPEDETQSRNVSFEALPYKPLANTSKKESQEIQKNNNLNLTSSITKKDLNEDESDVVKLKIEIVRGEASLLDSADEDSGIESSTLERKLSNV